MSDDETPTTAELDARIRGEGPATVPPPEKATAEDFDRVQRGEALHAESEDDR
jgi:hypothetical protein